MPMMTNPDIINTTGHGRRQSHSRQNQLQREPESITPQGGLQKQGRALRGRQSSANSTETTQYNSINYTTYRHPQLRAGQPAVDTQGPTPPDESRTTYSRPTRRTTEAEQSTERKAELNRLH